MTEGLIIVGWVLAGAVAGTCFGAWAEHRRTRRLIRAAIIDMAERLEHKTLVADDAVKRAQRWRKRFIETRKQYATLRANTHAEDLNPSTYPFAAAFFNERKAASGSEETFNQWLSRLGAERIEEALREHAGGHDDGQQG